MLRQLVVALVLANTGYFLWSQGMLVRFGLGPVNQSEAFRLDQQIQPNAIRLLPGTPSASAAAAPAEPVLIVATTPPDQARSAAALAASASGAGSASAVAPAAPATSRASSAAPAVPAVPGSASGAVPSPGGSVAAAAATQPGECLQAGVFSDAQANTLRARLQASLLVDRWTLEPVVEPARWIIYMGRYANDEMVAKKRSELRVRGVGFEAVQNPALNPGLSLGHFETRAEADRELAKDAERGVRTARVVQERAEVRGQRLVLPSVDAPLRTQLAALKPLLAGKALTTCR